MIRFQLWILGQNIQTVMCPSWGICRQRIFIWPSWVTLILITWPRCCPFPHCTVTNFSLQRIRTLLEDIWSHCEYSPFHLTPLSHTPPYKHTHFCVHWGVFTNQSLLWSLHDGDFFNFTLPFTLISWNSSFSYLFIISMYSWIPIFFNIYFDTHTS